MAEPAPEPAAGTGPDDPVHVYVYDAAGEDREEVLRAGLLREVAGDRLLWIDIAARDHAAIAQAAEVLSIDRRARDALLRERPLLGVDNYGEYQQFSLLPAAGTRDRAAGKDTSGRLDFVVGCNWLLTVHDAEVGFLREFRKQDKADTRTGRLTARAFAASLLDWHLESYFREGAALETLVERLDERIIVEPSSDSLLPQLLAGRRRISHLRRRLAAQRPVFYGLVRPDVAIQNDDDDAEPYVHLNQRFERALDEIERSRELLFSSFELLTSRLGQMTNDLVRALTFYTVVIGSVAAFAGLFGMNFDARIFHTGEAGFLGVAGGLALVSLGAVLWARSRNWL